MQMRTMQMGLAAGALVLVAGLAAAGDEIRVAVVDLERVIRAYPETAAAEDILMKQKDQFEAEHDKLVAEAERKKQEFEDLRNLAESKALSESARDEKIGEARAMMQDLVEMERKIRDNARSRNRELADEELRLRRRIIGKISDQVREYAAKEKLTLVLDSSALSGSTAQIVVYSIDTIDITKDILTLTGGVEDAESAEEP